MRAWRKERNPYSFGKLLSHSFALECNDKGKPYGWHWMEGAGADMPAISAAEALPLTMVEKALRP